MYEVWTITDLPVRADLTIMVGEYARGLDIDDFEALEKILEDWEDRMTNEAEVSRASENPLDAIEAKLEKISVLCDQVIRKLDSDSL